MKDYVTQLELMSDEELLKELEERFDHYIFSGLRVCDKKGNNLTREWFGDEFVARGLAMEIIQHVEDECRVISEVQAEEDDEEEDE